MTTHYHIPIQIKRLDKDLPMPKYESDGAAGIDIYASHDAVVRRDSHTIVKTGIAVQVPKDYEAQVRPRSGLAFKHGMTIVNSPGTVDCDYRGEIMCIMSLIGNEVEVHIKRGDRIAQMVVKLAPQATIYEVEELDDTERGEKGFGSTGT